MAAAPAAPGVPELGEAVQQHHQRARTRFDAVHADVDHRWAMPLALAPSVNLIAPVRASRDDND
jgi:hypothetical protein